MIYGASPEEYYTYNFKGRNDRGRREYVTDIGRFKYFELLNGSTGHELFSDKYKTYLAYRDYYKRDVILVNDKTMNEEIVEFISKHRKFIIKPLTLSMGQGIEIYDAHEKKIEDVKKHVYEKGECIFEELIQQSDLFNSFHPESMNTVRIPAFRIDNKTSIHFAFLRIGQKEAVVDNAGAGGIMVTIEPENGVTESLGMDEYGNEYVVHPDTGAKLTGVKLPDWDELKELVDTIMNINPNIRCIGWDFAHTKDGWVMVEGNDSNQFVWQMPAHRGCKKELDEMCFSRKA